MTVANGTRRNHRASDGKATYVPLWTVEAHGDWQLGELPIPVWLLEGGEHENRRLKLEGYIREKVLPWLEWKAKNGWEATTEPFIDMNSLRDGSSAFGAMADPEIKYVDIRCRFKRTYPLYISLSDFLQVRDDAQRYGVDLSLPKLPYNVLPKPKKNIEVTTWRTKK